MTTKSELVAAAEAIGNGHALAVRAEGVQALAVMSDEQFDTRLAQLKLGRERIAKIQREYMVADEDYGLIPNTPKPTLFKAGAEKLAQLYGLAARVESSFSAGDGEKTPPLTFNAECYLHLGSFDGPIVAVGHGTANSWEKRYRRDTKICPNCSQPKIIKSKYDPGWYCLNCKSKFGANDESITAQTSPTTGDVREAYDLGVTLLKMCLGGTTPILFRGPAGPVRHDIEGMFSHFVKGESLEVPGIDGTWRKVTDMSRLEGQDIYAIRLRDGSIVRATPEHRFPTQRGLLPVSDIVIGDSLSRNRPDLHTATSALTDIGWAAGFFVAEGHFPQNGAVRFTIHEDEIEYADRLAALAQQVGATTKTGVRRGTHTRDVSVYGQSFRGLIEQFVDGGKSQGKHFSRHVWRQGPAFVAAALDGYLAGDGSVTERHGHSRYIELGFTGENRELERDIRTACAILDRRVMLKRSDARLKGVAFPIFKGWIRDDPRYHAADLAAIVAIDKEPVPGPVYDIEVDGDHLFLLANGIVTHNSEKRAFVDSVLRATATSGLFTQDVSEEAPEVVSDVPGPSVAQRQAGDPSVTVTRDGEPPDHSARGFDESVHGPSEYTRPDAVASGMTNQQFHDMLDKTGSEEVALGPSSVEGVGRGGRTQDANEAQIAEVRRLAGQLGWGSKSMLGYVYSTFERDADVPEDGRNARSELTTFLDEMSAENIGILIQKLHAEVDLAAMKVTP